MDIIPVLQYFGITFSSVTPLVVVGGIGMSCVFRHTKPMRESIDAIKNNVTAISSFLSTTHRDGFPSSILKAMSPYQIQKDGYTILRESQMISILSVGENKNNIFDYIDAQAPKTKLDVERQALVAFNLFLDDEAFSPIKTYLYNHSETRTFFAFLAAVYIRDMYLVARPEIVE